MLSDAIVSRSSHRGLLPAACLGLLLACGGGDGPTDPPAAVLTGISASPTSVSLSGVGSSAPLTAVLRPTGVSASVSWTSDNSAVATVAGSGLTASVTAVSGGTTQLTARAGSFSASVAVTVTPIVRAITLPADSLRLTVGDTATQSPTLTADAGANATLTWSVSDPAVATVSAAGVVTAVTTGTTLLTVTVTAFPALSATRAIRVQPPTVQVMVAPSSASLATGDTLRLAATVAASAGVSTALTWASSASAVATVSASGLVTAVAAGAAQITASSVANPASTATSTITVTVPSGWGWAGTPGATVGRS